MRVYPYYIHFRSCTLIFDFFSDLLNSRECSISNVVDDSPVKKVSTRRKAQVIDSDSEDETPTTISNSR